MANKASSSTQSRKERSAAIRDAQKRRQRSISLAIGAIVAVVVIVLGLLVAKSLSGQKSTPAAAPGRASAAVTNAVSTVPTSVFDAIGVGLAQNPPKAVPGADPLTSGGKPRVLYVGSEFCPYCAAERWSLAAAMSRFGSFKNLGKTSSSDSDAFPGTNTLSFHGATYTSDYLAFSGYELQNRDRTKTLDTLPKADKAVLDKYDAPPYVDESSKGAIPFIDFGGAYISSGATYDPGVLKGLSHAQIAKALSDPSSKVAKSIDGSANVITAALCKVTGGKPGDVCTSSGVTAAAGKLG